MKIYLENVNLNDLWNLDNSNRFSKIIIKATQKYEKFVENMSDRITEVCINTFKRLLRSTQYNHL